MTNLPAGTNAVACSPTCTATAVTPALTSDVKFNNDLGAQTLVIFANNGTTQAGSAKWVPQDGSEGGLLPGWTLFVGVPACPPNTAGQENTTLCPITVTPSGLNRPSFLGAPACAPGTAGPANPAVCPGGTINVSVGGGLPITCTIGGAGSTGCATSDGGYQVTSKTSLVMGQPVNVMPVTSAGSSVWYGYVSATPGVGIQFSPYPKDTQTKITGNFTGPEASKIKTAIIEVRAGTDVVQGPFTATVQNNGFSYSGTGLTLVEGETVYVHAWEVDKANIGDPGEVSFPHQQNQPAVTSLYDMGRFKVYFSAGAEMDGGGGTLGTATGFVGVNMDSNLLTTGNETSGCFTGTNHPFRSTNANCDENVSRVMINTYLEGEFTQIPISSSSTGGSTSKPGSTTSTTGGAARSLDAMAAASGGSGGTGNGGTTPPTSTSSSTIDVSKAKGAYVVGGIYAPILLPAAQWRFRGQRNAFFFGPLANYGFQVPGNNPTGTPAFNVFRSYSGGFRIGHYQMPVRKRTSPTLISYLDVTWGKWQNFREAVTGDRGVRLDVTGRYKLPYTPLFIGFDSNTGPGGSDIRLYAGTRVDISTIIGKFVPNVN